jgi:hypothetical protein
MGMGQTQGQGESGGGAPQDYVRNPAGKVSGPGHNFMTNPAGTVSGGPPSDPLKAPAPAQPSGPPADINSESVPAGGRYLPPDLGDPLGDKGVGSVGDSRKPFTLR